MGEGGNVTKPTYIFRCAEVVAWLNKLIGRAPPVTVVPGGMTPVVEAAEAAGIAITVLVNAIATGHVRVERVLKGKRNLRGALVLLDAVKAYRKLVGPQAAADPLRHYTKRRAAQSQAASRPRRSRTHSTSDAFLRCVVRRCGVGALLIG